MKIKAHTPIEIIFYAEPIEDIDSYILMEQVFDSFPQLRVSNPGYRELKAEKSEKGQGKPVTICAVHKDEECQECESMRSNA